MIGSEQRASSNGVIYIYWILDISGLFVGGGGVAVIIMSLWHGETVATVATDIRRGYFSSGELPVELCGVKVVYGNYYYLLKRNIKLLACSRK